MGYRQIFLIAFIQISFLTNAQLYVLKDQRPDTSKYNCMLHEELPVLCDTFYRAISHLDFEILYEISLSISVVPLLDGTHHTSL